ncbi:7TM diverse intracellular signaling domain-containing protein [Bernardetia sp.]|uniref:7TM diverse intracellular signaling domain-containing protein n=1 Tax=Bernardetia sp. TaxID=1937974 RepID=UPI0025C5FD6B|nr:7TM diverse intracellular signaling domain-containing protein [Bernardetia sp.]
MMPRGYIFYFLINLFVVFYANTANGQQDTTIFLLDSSLAFSAQKLETEFEKLNHIAKLSSSDSTQQLAILDSLIQFYKEKNTKKFNYFLSEKQNLKFKYILPLELPKKGQTRIKESLGIWKDTTNGTATIEDIINNPNITFSKNNITYANMEVGAYYWIRVKLVGNGVRDENVALQVGSVFETWSEIIFYEPVEDEAFRIERSGTDVDPENKPVKQWRNYFNIDVPSESEVTVYIRIHSNAKRFHPKFIYAFIEDAANVRQGADEFTYAQGIFQGILWVMAFYNLLLFFIIRDKLYIYYVLMIVGIQLNVFYYYRYIYFLFPTSHLLIRSCIVISHLFMIGGGLLFLKSFLNVKELLPKWNKIINGINYVLAIAVIAYISNNLLSSTPDWNDKVNIGGYSLLIILSIALISIILAFMIGVMTLRKGYLAARYYLIATSGLLIGGFFYAMSYLFYLNGVEVESDIFTYLFQAGVVVQLVFYALGIGYQVNRLEREKSDALAENLELQKETTTLLEKKVKQRTVEIEQQKEEIEAINTSLMEQKGLMEKRNNDITSSINYARRIQDAVLPDLRTFKKNIPNCFILYKPRDIVSGDFYWFAKKDNQIIVAAADCTGHGVPGAFMSILGDSYLNQIVNLQGITKADSILSRLHGQIRRALRQSSTENKDGMDISICVIDLEQKHVTFAGAKRPLLYIQNETIFEIKGDKHSVGGFQTKAENAYTSHQVNFDEPTTFYIFSDGYVDQFGGKQNRKFMTKRFKQLLLDIHKEPMVRQRQLLAQEFDDWKGNNKQIDDVIVVGFQV